MSDREIRAAGEGEQVVESVELDTEDAEAGEPNDPETTTGPAPAVPPSRRFVANLSDL
jgi:hypothetical protein